MKKTLVGLIILTSLFFGCGVKNKNLSSAEAINVFGDFHQTESARECYQEKRGENETPEEFACRFCKKYGEGLYLNHYTDSWNIPSDNISCDRSEDGSLMYYTFLFPDGTLKGRGESGQCP